MNLANGHAGAKPDWRLLKQLTKGWLLTAPGHSFELHQVQRLLDVRRVRHEFIDNTLSALYHDRGSCIMVQYDACELCPAMPAIYLRRLYVQIGHPCVLIGGWSSLAEPEWRGSKPSHGALHTVLHLDERTFWGAALHCRMCEGEFPPAWPAMLLLHPARPY